MPELKQVKGKLSYTLKGYDKQRDVMTLIDPHTGKQFTLQGVREVVKRAGYGVLK